MTKIEEPRTTRRFSIRGQSLQERLITLIIVLLIAYLCLVPLLYLLWGTFFDGQKVTLDFFTRAYTAYQLDTLAWNSLQFAIGSTVLAVVVGTALAYLASRTDIPFKGLVFAVSLIPLIIPGILHTIAWIFLASPRSGLFNRLLEPITSGPLFNVYSMPGMIVVEGLHLAPVVFLLMYAAFRSMDPSLEESALASGARLPTVITRITLPLVKPALFSAILITAVRAIESFETPALIGIPGGIWVFTSRIWRVLHTYPADFGQAGAYSVSLLALTALGLYWNSRLTKRAGEFQTVTGKGFRPRQMVLGRYKWIALTFVGAYFLLAALLPMLMLLYVSFQRYYSTFSLSSVMNVTWDNYAQILGSDQALRALQNSFLLGLGSATAVMLITGIASWIVVRTRIRGRQLVDHLAFLPLAIPGLVLGVALLFVYLRMPIAIYGSLWILFIAYVTRFMPYGMRYASAAMYQIGSELEESARASGASWLQIMRRIYFPLLFPGLLAGWIYVVMVSIRELSSSILLYSPGDEVLAIMIWELWDNGQVAQLSALGVIMITLMVFLVVVAQRLGARIGVKA